MADYLPLLIMAGLVVAFVFFSFVASQLLADEYGLYFKVARVFAKVIGNPPLLNELTRVGMHSRTLMEWVLRIMANLLRPDEVGPAEAVYKVVAQLARVVPEPVAS